MISSWPRFLISIDHAFSNTLSCAWSGPGLARQQHPSKYLELQATEALLDTHRRELGTTVIPGIIGESVAMKTVLHLIRKTEQSEIPVYIFGESGTGKELVAHAIHQISPRRQGPLITINCGALSASLLASELFGHVRGAFTGAIREHPGLIRAAHGGTIFLDEVTEMGPEIQVQLLRVLQTGDYRPVGSEHELKADVRVISASNLDLEEAVRRGQFSEDLFYRLNVLRVDLPPLRARREDIPLLVRHFLGALPIHPSALAQLMDYSWPGNVRELSNELERAKVLADGIILPAALSAKIRGQPESLELPEGTLTKQLAELERRILLVALEEAEGHPSRAARQLGLSRSGLHKKLTRHGIAPRTKSQG